MFICKFCLDIYEKPVILPCGNLLCSKHIDKFLKSKTSQSILCYHCDRKHDINKQGLIVDERITQLIELKIHELNLGTAHRAAIISCQNVESLITQHKSLNQNPNNFIDAFFNKLKKEINIKRIEMIAMVDDSYRKSLKEIECFENECKNNPDKDKNILGSNSLVVICEAKLKEWYQVLRVPNLDLESNWKELKFEADREIQKLDTKLRVVKNELLLNRDFTIKPINSINLDISFDTFQIEVIIIYILYQRFYKLNYIKFKKTDGKYLQ